MVPKIVIGSRVGRLTVASDTGKRKNGYTIWHCACDCGGSIDLDTRCLQRETVRDCGCVSAVKPGQKDLTGQRFGKLTALEPTSERGRDGGTVWRCLCDCGQECLAISTQLAQGQKKSCGCLSHPPVKDYVGKRFGRLTVTAYDGKRGGKHYWRCLCDCGNETVVSQSALQNRKTKSCGCLQAEIIFENMKFIDGTSVTALEKAPTRLISTNSSGHNGVYLSAGSGKWVAQITLRGKTYYLGSYDKIQDAAEARRKAEEQMYGEVLEEYYRSNREESGA